MFIILRGGDVLVVHLELYVGVDTPQCVERCLDLRHARLLGAEEEAIHVRQLHLVIVEKQQLADAATGEHLRHYRAHTPDAHNEHSERSDLLVILDDAHPFQGHQAAVGIVVADLGAHLSNALPASPRRVCRARRRFGAPFRTAFALRPLRKPVALATAFLAQALALAILAVLATFATLEGLTALAWGSLSRPTCPAHGPPHGPLPGGGGRLAPPTATNRSI
mmetsp:Transcript_60013/g.131867  ORF Transcript_60013/g.131867 Transcript_60013/m.131867 type:complete len:222 (+) Transcript_60013:684-1349(+)